MQVNARGVIAAWVVLLAAGAPCAAQGRAHDTLVDVARRDGSFKTLLAAVEAAGLAGALGGEGPLTLFAPTDEAFRALPAGALDALLREPAALRRVLEGHLGRGARRAAEVVEYEAVTTLAGTRLAISTAGGEVRIGGARVVRADLLARNGVIHAIDRVLLPEAPRAPTLLGLASGVEELSTLVAAARAAGLEGALAGAGPLTVLAPSNAAFAALPPGALEALLRDPDRLRRILLHHVVEGEVRSDALAGRRTVTTLAGTTLDVDARGPGLVVGGARVVAADLGASNGVAHRIDRLLLPPPQDARTSQAGHRVDDYQPAAPARHVMKKTVRGPMGRVERTELAREVGRGEAGVQRIVDSEGEYQDFLPTPGGAMAGQSMTAQGFVQRYEPALRLFPAVAREGEAETFESEVIHRSGRRETRGAVRRVVVLEGVEDVETPAGRFSGCLRFRVEQRNQPDLSASFVAETRETVWLAPGVGEVKSVSTTSLRTGPVPWLTAEVTLELASRDR